MSKVEVDSGRPLPPNVTPERPWMELQECPQCSALVLRPLRDEEFREVHGMRWPAPVLCDRCRSDSR
jgi:hypothetical protein